MRARLLHRAASLHRSFATLQHSHRSSSTLQQSFAAQTARCEGHVRAALGTGDRGRGLFASEAIATGDVVIAVPTDTWRPLSAEAARDKAPASVIEALDAVDGRVGAGGQLARAMLCTLNVLADADSAYVSSLPPAPSVPVLWDETRCAALEASPLRAKAGATRRLWTACHASLQLKLELEPFLGLVALVRSRAYAKRPVFTMVPVIEMANHAAQPNCDLRFDEAQGAFELVALADVAAGAELTVAYGPLSNADLLDAYGFTTPGNLYESVSLAVADTDSDILLANSPLAPAALKHYRRENMTTEDKVNAAHRGLGGSGVDHSRPLTLRNERAAVNDVIAAVEERLGAYKTSPDADATALEGGSLPDWERGAVRVRMGEKLALLQQLERAATSLRMMN